MCRDVDVSTEFDISAGPGERWIFDIEVCKIMNSLFHSVLHYSIFPSWHSVVLIWDKNRIYCLFEVHSIYHPSNKILNNTIINIHSV